MNVLSTASAEQHVALWAPPDLESGVRNQSTGRTILQELGQASSCKFLVVKFKQRADAVKT